MSRIPCIAGNWKMYKTVDEAVETAARLKEAVQDVSGRDIGIAEDLTYVYLGNVAGHPYENTYCPNCNKLLIERYIFDIRAYHITAQKTCPGCNQVIPIVGSYIKNS